MIDETLLDAEEKMEKAVTVAKDDFGGIRTGRATPAMFNKIVVDYYGAMTPINQLSSLTVPEPRMAVISPYDKSSLGVDRAGDPRLRPRRQPDQRRQHHPHRLPAAHRGAAQRVHQGRAQQGGGRAGLDPQHPPQGQGGARPPGQGRRGRRGRGRRARRRSSRRRRRSTSHTVDELLKHKEAELLEV